MVLPFLFAVVEDYAEQLGEKAWTMAPTSSLSGP